MDIVHPETGEKINIFSQQGLNILNRYVKNYKYGGSIENKLSNLQNKFNNINKYFISQHGGMMQIPSSDDSPLDSSDGVIGLYNEEELAAERDLLEREFISYLKNTGEIIERRSEFPPHMLTVEYNTTLIYKFFTDEEIKYIESHAK